MAFQKVGSPQPLEIVSDKCEMCGQNIAQFHVNGKFVCGTCKDSMQINDEKLV